MEILNEIFDSTDTYEYTNILPKAKVPQTFLLNGVGLDNIIVRFMGQDSGDKIKNLKESDKHVVVYLMSMSETGNQTLLKNGLGPNPIKTISTVYEIINKNLNVPHIDSILFRFSTKAMKGREATVRKIFDKIVMTKGRGRFVTLKEMENYTGKFTYIVSHKKNFDISKLPGANNIDPKYKEVETKVGETFIDTTNGKQVSKSEVIADAIARSENKIKDTTVIDKTRISRRELMVAQYGHTSAYGFGSEGQEKLDKTLAEVVAVSTKGLDDYTHFRDYGDALRKEKAEYVNERIELLRSAEEAEKNLTPGEINAFDDTIGMSLTYNVNVAYNNLLNAGISKPKALYTIRQYYTILLKLTPENMDKSLRSITMLVTDLKLPQDVEVRTASYLVRDAVSRTSTALGKIIGETKMDLDQKSEGSIYSYCGQNYENINNYLIGEAKLDKSNEHLDSIKNLDNAFVNGGVKLPSGVKVYRGMRVEAYYIERILATKTFYFRNFVSTSLVPLFLAGGFGTLTSQFTHPKVSDDSVEDKLRHSAESGNKVELGLTISGADKIKVVIPGKLSPYGEECEVILPRGVAIRFDDVFTSRVDDNDRVALALTSVINPDQLNENEVVYDGDALIESGKLVEMDKFSISSFVALEESYQDSESVNQVWADIIALDNSGEEDIAPISDKFMIA